MTDFSPRLEFGPPDTIQERARSEAEKILAYFANLEKLGAFAHEPVHEQKRCFLQMCLINFASDESRRGNSK